MWTDYMHWLHGLPLWGQVFVISFEWSFAAWLPIAIFEQAAGFNDREPWSTPWWVELPLGAAVIFWGKTTTLGRTVMEWPDRHIPHWHTHWFVIMPAVLLSGALAKKLVILFARRSVSAAPSGGLVPTPSIIRIIRRRVSILED